jgi:SAM-dependent methyltransferase
MTEHPDYQSIVSHYEACLALHGDSHLGVDWPKAEDIDTRHRVMLDVVRGPGTTGSTRLLDFGCGASHLFEYIEREGIPGIEYSGLDLSQRFVDLSRRKFPANQYWCLDILSEEARQLPRFDYVVMSGVFTEKLELTFDDMFSFLRSVISTVYDITEVGLAFNVMTKHVDWERDDLFHLPFDALAAWLKRDVSRNFVIRNDYGLYEYTVYVYR